MVEEQCYFAGIAHRWICHQSCVGPPPQCPQSFIWRLYQSPFAIGQQLRMGHAGRCKLVFSVLFLWKGAVQIGENTGFCFPDPAHGVHHRGGYFVGAFVQRVEGCKQAYHPDALPGIVPDHFIYRTDWLGKLPGREYRYWSLTKKLKMWNKSKAGLHCLSQGRLAHFLLKNGPLCRTIAGREALHNFLSYLQISAFYS